MSKEEEEDYVVLTGPFPEPDGLLLQEELLVALHAKQPSAPPLAESFPGMYFFLGNQRASAPPLMEKNDVNPYVQLLKLAAEEEVGNELHAMQNHVLFQLLAEFYGAQVKFDASKLRRQSLQDRIRRLNATVWEKKVHILLLRNNNNSGGAEMVLYTGQTQSRMRKLQENVRSLLSFSHPPGNETCLDPGTFLVAKLLPKVCEERERKKVEMSRVALEEVVDSGILTSAKRSAAMHYVLDALNNEFDIEEWKAMCDVLLHHQAQQPSELVHVLLHEVVTAILLHTPSNSNEDDYAGLDHQVWLLRRAKQFGWKLQLLPLLFTVRQCVEPAPEEWKQRDWLDRWLILLRVCCEPIALHSTAVDLEVMFAFLNMFPFEEGLLRIEALICATDVEARVAQVLEVLTQACLHFYASANRAVTRELGMRMCLVLERFSHTTAAGVDELVLQACPALALVHWHEKPAASSILAQLSRTTCWKMLAKVLFGTLELADGSNKEEEAVLDEASVYAVAPVQERLWLVPHNYSEWRMMVPYVRGALIHGRGCLNPSSALAFLSTLALFQPDAEFRKAVAKELVGLSYLHSLLPTAQFANEWLVRLGKEMPQLFASVVLPLLLSSQQQQQASAAFLHQIAEFDHLLSHADFHWLPVSEQDIDFLPRWLSAVPKWWPQASPPKFIIAHRLLTRVLAEALPLHLNNSFAANIALALVAMEDQLARENRLAQLIASTALARISQELWQVLLKVKQHEDGGESEDALVAAQRLYPTNAMLAFVLAMQRSVWVLPSLVQVLVVPHQPTLVYRAARLVACRLPEFHPILLTLARMGGSSAAQDFVNEVVLQRDEDVRFWLQVCEPSDVDLANCLVEHWTLPPLPAPRSGDEVAWPLLLVKFAHNDMQLLPRRLRCQVLIAQTVLQMRAWFLLGAHLLENALVSGNGGGSAKQVLEMDHEHLEQIIRLLDDSTEPIACPRVDDFTIFAWTDFLLSFTEVNVFDEECLVSLSICAQFLSSLQHSSANASEFGNLFFQYKNILLPGKIAQALERMAKDLHMQALQLAESCRAPVLLLGEFLVDMATTRAMKGCGDAKWMLFSEHDMDIKFDRLCITSFQPVALALSPPQQLALALDDQPAASLLLPASPAAIPAPTLARPRRRMQFSVVDLLRQATLAICETRQRVEDLNELETKQIVQLYAHVSSTMPVHDLAQGAQIVSSQTVTVSILDLAMEEAWRLTMRALNQEMDALQTRFSPDSFCSLELFDSVHDMRQRMMSLEDCTQEFMRLFALDFCKELLECNRLKQAWIDLCQTAMLHCDADSLALYMLQGLVRRPWRISAFHTILPSVPPAQLLSAYKLVLAPGGLESAEDRLRLLEALARTQIPEKDVELIRGLIELCFETFRVQRSGKIVDYLLRNVLKRALPLLLALDGGRGIALVCRLLMNNTNGDAQEPLPCIFWQEVSSVDDCLWDFISLQACVEALEELRPRPGLRGGFKMCWNQGFISLALLLCKHQELPTEDILACWEKWLEAAEEEMDESLLNAFILCLQQHVQSKRESLLRIFCWYAGKPSLPQLARKLCRLDWSRLLVPSSAGDEFLHALEQIHFRNHVLQTNKKACSPLLQSLLASASFAREFHLEECEPEFLDRAFRFALLLVRSNCAVSMLCELPFEHLLAEQLVVSSAVAMTEEEFALLVSVAVRNVAHFSPLFLSSVLSPQASTWLSKEMFYCLLNAYRNSSSTRLAQSWIIPYLISFLSHKECEAYLDQFCAQQQPQQPQQSQQERGAGHNLINALLPSYYFAATEVYIIAHKSGGGIKPWNSSSGLCKDDTIGSLARSFLLFDDDDEEEELVVLALMHAAQLGSCRIVNELGRQIDLHRVLAPNNSHLLTERDCLAHGCVLLLLASFLQEDLLRKSFYLVQHIHYEAAGRDALMLVCVFARQLQPGPFSLDLAEEAGRIMCAQSARIQRRQHEDALLCVAFAVFADLLLGLVWKERGGGNNSALPNTYNKCGWRCSKLDWLGGEIAALNRHSLPWLMDQVRFTLFPYTEHCATRLPRWDRAPLAEGEEFLVL